MAFTFETPDQIYKDLLTQARAAVAIVPSPMAASRVHLTPILATDGVMTPAIRIIVPGAGAFLADADTGHGLVREEFQVAIMEKINVDRHGSHSEALSVATRTILQIVNRVRGDFSGAGTPTVPLGLIWYRGEGAEPLPIVEAVTLRGWSGMQLDPLDPTYMMWVDRYRVGYELELLA